jgi:hypothetical protein
MPADLKERLKDGSFEFECFRCGSFSISADADSELRRHVPGAEKIAIASGYIRRNAGLRIEQTDLSRLLNLVAPSVTEKVGNLLHHLAREFPTPGERIQDPAVMAGVSLRHLKQFEPDNVFPAEITAVPGIRWLKWLAIASALNASELDWLIREALKNRGYLRDGQDFILDNRGYKSLIITPSGWDAVERLQEKQTDSRIGFVAMSFRPEFSELYEKGISEGIRLAGFEPLRIDRTEHNNRIDDEIVASIKRSRFLVADFTLQRGGIYFEAGYALGIGLRVIWLIRSDELAAVHFDTRQYNFIRWNDGEWTALQRALRNRIEATIGVGPLEDGLRSTHTF